MFQSIIFPNLNAYIENTASNILLGYFYFKAETKYFCLKIRSNSNKSQYKVCTCIEN